MNPGWQNLIENLKRKDVLKTRNIIDAFENIDRKDFVLDEYKSMAYIDEALPILEGQTISQPYTVAFMLELLQPKPGDKILDIGSGSGWQTALLAHIVGVGHPMAEFGHRMANKGRIYAMEIIPEICEFGKTNISKYNLNIEWFCQDASKGLPEKAPFDKIIAAAALDNKVPQEWFSQLKTNGRLVVPVKNSIWLFVKKDENNIEKHEYPGFAFVPFQS